MTGQEAQSIAAATQRAEAELLRAQAALEEKTKELAEETRVRKELLEAEREVRLGLERVSLLKDEFLATLSHELRTPLNSMLGWSEMLLMREDVVDRVRHGLETISRNARVQAKMIDDLLDMNQIISGKVRLEVQRLDLAKIVEAAAESIGPSAAAKGVRLTRIIDPAAGQVAGDPSRLQQILWNLLTNAIKFTPKGGHIEIILSRVASHLEVTVEDSGVGISAEFLPHIFDRFRQADSSTTRSYGGLGLGLSIVKQLVELHGGGVRVESRGQGLGTSFIVRLPLVVLREDAGLGQPVVGLGQKNPSQLFLEGLKVLLVDDEPDARELLRVVLESNRAEVHTAASAAEAIEELRVYRPDVIVSDIGMPGKDGYQFLREVRALPPTEGGKTAAIALTAFARSEDRTKAMLAGFQVHIAKPIEAPELIATIASLAGRTGSNEA